MATCKFCEIPLNALNISDVEDNCCGECCDKELDKILHIGDELLC